MQQEIEQKIIQELGLENLEQSERERVISALGGLVLQNVLIKVTEALSNEDVILFEKVVSSEDQDRVGAFLSEKVPDIQGLIGNASREVIEEYKKG